MQSRRDSSFILFGEGPDHFSWRGVSLFVVAYFAAFIVAAVVAPFVWWIVQSLDTSSSGGSVIEYLQGKPFFRYVDRIRLLFAAFLLLWMIRTCGLWGRFGFYWRQRGPNDFIQYMILGLISMGLVVWGQGVYTGWIARNGWSAGYIAEVMAVALAGAVLVSWLEEAIFRGLLFRMFYTATTPEQAVLLSALVFAVVHFKQVPFSVGTDVHLYTGLQVALPQSVSFLFTVSWTEFFNYVLVGIVLNLVFLRTGSLVPCMGLHAGWVLARNAWTRLVDVPLENSTQFWGTERIVDGHASFMILSLIAVILYARWRRSQFVERESRPATA